MVRRLGAEPTTAREANYHEAFEGNDPSSGLAVIQVDRLDGLTVTVEPNGYLLVQDQQAKAVSAGSELVSLYWNVNALMRLVLAREGQVIRAFDPLLYDQAGVGDPLPEEAGLPFGQPDDALAAAAKLFERLSGIRPTRRWLLETRHPTWRLEVR